jgi:hypothetical protein
LKSILKKSFVSFVVALLLAAHEAVEPQQIVAVTRPVGSWQGRQATVGDIPRNRALSHHGNLERIAGRHRRFKLTAQRHQRPASASSPITKAWGPVPRVRRRPQNLRFPRGIGQRRLEFRVEETTGAFVQPSEN